MLCCVYLGVPSQFPEPAFEFEKKNICWIKSEFNSKTSSGLKDTKPLAISDTHILHKKICMSSHTYYLTKLPDMERFIAHFLVFVKSSFWKNPQDL